MSAELNATVIQRAEINHGLLVLRVAPDAELPAFKAGQYVVLGLPAKAARVEIAEPEPAPEPGKADDLIKRAYSIASSSSQGEYLEFYVALVHTGALTPRIFALQEGDRIFLGKKVVGMFTLDDVPADHDLLFIATGTGLAPYLSMLRSAYRFEPRKTVVVHGARTSWDLGYRTDLEALAARFDTFHYLPIIDQAERDPGWKGSVGFVDRFFDDGALTDLLGRPVGPEKLGVFLCGNPLMVESVKERLLAAGLQQHTRKNPGNIFIEEYWKD